MFLIRDPVTVQPRPRGSWRTPPPESQPLVLHVDMDAFFASVETRADPRLENRPVVVGGGPEGRGVVTTASYSARDFGIASGMSLAEARRRCPGILVIPVDPPKYVHESLAVLRVLDRVSPRVEAASIDEAYLEMEPRPPERWGEAAETAARKVRDLVLRERGLSCSVGAAVRKLQAKMASARAKPAGVLVLSPGRFLEVFGADPVSCIPGVGPRTTEVLGRLGIRTIRDLAGAGPERMHAVFGSWGSPFDRSEPGGVVAAGEEPYPKSAGHETTFHRDVGDPVILRSTLCLLADRVARRLRLYGARARTAAVRFKVNGNRYSRQRVLHRPTDDAVTLTRTAWDLLEGARRGRALRLVGVAGMGLVPGEGEASLFREDVHRRLLVEAGDRVRSRFGENAILPGEVFRRRRR